MSQRVITAWLRHCIDPLGPRPNPPSPFLSAKDVSALLFRAAAHHVLPVTLQNFPFPLQNSEYEKARQEGNATRTAGLALSMMLNHHAKLVAAAAEALPFIIVKGPTFARTIYPNAQLRPFTDIDLLIRPDASAQIDSILLSQGFGRAEGPHPASLEAKWTHCETGALVEVHTNLVHHQRMRSTFSLTYDDLEQCEEAPATQLIVACTHGGMHYFAWLRHIVDICQAARNLATSGDEAHFERLAHRTGTRFLAIIGLALGYRLVGELRCLEIAQGLGSPRHAWTARFLTWAADLTATSNNWLVYNTWRRYIIRELLRHGA